MRVLIMFCLVIFLNAKNFEIIKYVQNEKPKIVVEYNNVPKNILSLLIKDTKLISHYDMDIKGKISDNRKVELQKYKGYNFLLRLNYKNKVLHAMFYNLIKHKVKMNNNYKIRQFNYYPFLVHQLSYDINSKIGFKPINWIKKKIVYSIYMAPKEQAIFIADVTLTYRKKIISGGSNIFPKWANEKQTEIYYTKLQKQPVLYKYNIYTGKKERILSSNGMLVVSDVNKDNLLLTLAIVDDQPDVYQYNIKTKALKRLTTFDGIDVNGHFYEDNKIVFISDRLGYPNVYQKDLENGVVSKVIYHGKNHISVTTHDDKIVISSRETNKAFSSNTFNLLLLNKDNSFVKRLTFGGKNILPIFSQDGSTILFAKEYQFNSKLGIIRLNENKIFYFKISRKIQSFDF